jgi:ribonuclease P protein component, eubacterial
LSDISAAAARLRRASEFENVLANARRASSRNFSGWAQPNEAGVPRLGIIAGRKAAPRAVDRNRGKRLIRECFRAAFAELGSLDVIVQVRTPLRDSNNEALRAELRELLHKLRAMGERQSHGR